MKKILALVLALCMVFALCACGSSSGDSDTPAASTVSLNVGTGGESGTYYGYTGILGTVIGQKTDVKLTVVATGGSKDNLVSMQDGMYDLATVQSDVMTYAYNGTNSFADSGKIDGYVSERPGAVYLAALGGAGALMAKSVQTLEVIAWPDLGCEAVRRLTVQEMPLTVILDAHGGDLYQSGPAAYLESK